MPELKLLVITDIHYDPAGSREMPHRNCQRARQWLRRAVKDALRTERLDGAILLGDLLNDARVQNAPRDVADLLADLDELLGDLPRTIVPGNHDYMASGTLPPGLDGRTRLWELGGYRFAIFADRYVDAMVCTRSEADRRWFARLAGSPGRPIVALQHNPMNPEIVSDYPHMLTNRRDVLADYAQAGVMLSLSGHYHPGQELNERDGVQYATLKALFAPPHHYTILTLRGQDVRIDQRTLAQPEGDGLVDSHAHSEYAYCAGDLTTDVLVERSREMGLAGVVVAEHAPQLYLPRDGFWDGRHVADPRTWRSPSGSRMAGFRRFAEARRSEFLRFGFEVELDRDGDLTIHDDDRVWAELLLGAIHWLPRDVEGLSAQQVIDLFARTSLGLIEGGIDVLAHPFRYLARRGIAVPRSLHADLAAALAERGVAAELNFHHATPDSPSLEFFAACLQRGVKISLATDAHHPWQAGGLGAHRVFLRKLTGRDSFHDVLAPRDGLTDPA